VIKDTRVPFITASKNHINSFHSVSVWLHLEVRKAVNDVQWDHVTVVSTNTLSTAKLHRTVINVILVGLKLSRRVNGPTP
jgi:hypothetical protein